MAVVDYRALDNDDCSGAHGVWPDNVGVDFSSRIIRVGIGTTSEEDIRICYPSLVLDPLKGYQKGANWTK